MLSSPRTAARGAVGDEEANRGMALLMVANKCVPSRERVRQVATAIRALGRLPQDKEESSSVALDTSLVPDFYFALVAICHQTSPLEGPRLSGRIGSDRFVGWDYLRLRFMQAVSRTNGDCVRPRRLVTLTATDIDEIFRDDDGVLLLTASDERARLLNDLGRRCQALGLETAQQIYEQSAGTIDGEGGLLARLSQFEAYSDPVRKKSLFLLALMQNHGLWSYRDPEHLKSPVDYHEVRGHLRIGTVMLVDQRLKEAVERGTEVSGADDVAIRAAVAQALDWLAEETGHSQSELHYFLWNLFRSCCPRDSPHCQVCPETCGLPPRYRLKSERACALATACSSASSELKITEHRVRTQYY